MTIKKKNISNIYDEKICKYVLYGISKCLECCFFGKRGRAKIIKKYNKNLTKHATYIITQIPFSNVIIIIYHNLVEIYLRITENKQSIHRTYIIQISVRVQVDFNNINVLECVCFYHINVCLCVYACVYLIYINISVFRSMVCFCGFRG